MRALITGGGGLLGSNLIRHAPGGVELHSTLRTRPVHGATAHPVDLADQAPVKALFARLRPDVVLHAAYGPEGERDIVCATANVAAAARSVGAALVHVSSDMVFDGEHAPYLESDRPAPIHDYGRWKARAEEAVAAADPAAAIVRTSLIVSLDPLDRASEWVAAGLRGDGELRLFVDELRSPILAEDLARLIWEIAALPAAERRGTWHLAGPEALSRYSIGLLLAAHLGLPAARITPALSEPGAARPRDLRMRTARADRTLRHRPHTLASAVAAGYVPADDDDHAGAGGRFVPSRLSSS